eukprot:3285135-Prymnesium_polylepis.2
MMNNQENEAPYGDGEAPWIVVEGGNVSYTRRRQARSRAFTEIYEPWLSTEYPVSELPPTTYGTGSNPSTPSRSSTHRSRPRSARDPAAAPEDTEL